MQSREALPECRPELECAVEKKGAAAQGAWPTRAVAVETDVEGGLPVSRASKAKAYNPPDRGRGHDDKPAVMSHGGGKDIVPVMALRRVCARSFVSLGLREFALVLQLLTSAREKSLSTAAPRDRRTGVPACLTVPARHPLEDVRRPGVPSSSRAGLRRRRNRWTSSKPSLSRTRRDLGSPGTWSR